MNCFAKTNPLPRPWTLESPAQPRARLLVVEDDADIREIFSEALMLSGYRVDTAEDGEAGWNALHAVSGDRYDLLITDNSMPKLSGVELVKKLRAERMFLPVILASGSTPMDTASLQLAASLRKPFLPDELVQAVQEVLQRTRAANDPQGGKEFRRLETPAGETTNELTSMNKLEIKGDWNIAKGKMKQKWAHLTDGDLQFIEGKEEELIGRIQKRTGEARENVERALHDSCCCSSDHKHDADKSKAATAMAH